MSADSMYTEKLRGCDLLDGLELLNMKEWIAFLEDLVGGHARVHQAVRIPHTHGASEWVATTVRKLSLGARSLAGQALDILLVLSHRRGAVEVLDAVLALASMIIESAAFDRYCAVVTDKNLSPETRSCAARILVDLSDGPGLAFWDGLDFHIAPFLAAPAVQVYARALPERLFERLEGIESVSDPDEFYFPLSLAVRNMVNAGQAKEISRWVSRLPGWAQGVAREVLESERIPEFGPEEVLSYHVEQLAKVVPEIENPRVATIRLPAINPDVVIHLNGGPVASGRIEDYSLDGSGLGMVVDQELRKGQAIEVAVGDTRFDGVVSRCDPTEGGWKVGVTICSVEARLSALQTQSRE